MRSRPGFALLISLLVMALLVMAGAGVLALGARESEVAGAMARRAAARVAAESGARWTLAGWSTRRYRDLAHGEMSVHAGISIAPGIEASATVTRLGETLYLVRCTARYRTGLPSAVGSAGALVRTVDPDSLLVAFPAAIAADVAAEVEAGAVTVGGGQCGSQGAAPGVVAPRVTVGQLARVEGAPPVLIAAPPPIPMPGLFVPPLLDAVATMAFAAPVARPTPEPGEAGCRNGVTNWGAVSPVSPCHDHLPFVHAIGRLAVLGGEARAFLLVDGDLLLEDVRFHGVILVRGTLTIGPGSAIRGAVRARSVHLRGGSIAHDACEAGAALTAGGLDRPFRPRHRLWIPLF